MMADITTCVAFAGNIFSNQIFGADKQVVTYKVVNKLRMSSFKLGWVKLIQPRCRQGKIRSD